MTPLSIAFVAAAAICIAAGLQHAVMAWRVDDRKAQVLFAIASFAVAADALFERRILNSTTPEEFLAGMPWTALSSVTAVLALSWYIAFRTGVARRWLLWFLSVVGLLTVVLDFLVGISFKGPAELSPLTLPWGEQIAFASGTPNPLRLVGDIFLFGFLFYLLDVAIRTARRGDRRLARFIGGSLAFYGLALLTIIPADLGWFYLPSARTFAFLFIIAAMSWEMSGDLIHASKLSQEVLAGERRWRQLLEDVQLLAARIDHDGHVVEINPHFVQVLGWEIEDTQGREYWSFVAPDQREERRTAFQHAMAGKPISQVEVTAVAKDGSLKNIVWRNVLLRDRNGEIEGMLSIGTDLTDQREAQAERDRVLGELEVTVRELELVRSKLEEENVVLKEEIGSRTEHSEILGTSDALLYVLHKITQVAATDATVLIQGETGVGKEMVATGIHRESERATGAFLAVNCAALPASLIESELFGHERGAFTGADRRRQGRFELANGGTMFLDEVGELPIEVQPKLLRALQEGSIERIGGTEPIEVDVRLIAATNRNLREEVEAGRFREDLFYRLEVFPITVPPLRERREDIEVLVHHFAGSLAKRHGIEIQEIPTEVMRQLEGYDWPGNVRELQNIIERAVLTSTDGVLRLAGPLNAAKGDEADISEPQGRVFRTLEEIQRDHILAVIKACGGQIAGRVGAAKILGVHPNTLRSRLKKLGISPQK